MVSRGTRRRTEWARTDATVSISGANAWTTIDLLASWKTAGGVQQAVTVGRTHLRIVPISTQGVAGNRFHVGLIRGQFNDIGASIAGSPNPSLDLNEDWLLWDELTLDNALNLTMFGASQVQYDNKSMRKLESLQVTYNLVLGSPLWGTFPLNFRVAASVLLFLP
jgi:hypothetical protein